MNYYLWSIGCQMNAADATRISTGLAELGLGAVEDSTQADLVILVTCVVRQSAEDKVLGRLRSLKNLKRQQPGTAIAVMGCFVGDVEALQQHYPYVDAFFKPSDLAGLLTFVRQRWPAAAKGSITGASPSAQDSVSAAIPISYGCDHHCTYCIVRLRRGGQQSRPLADILADVRGHACQGVREITLLGQNVDAYGHDLGSEAPDLADVLTAVHADERLWRIRFLTSHPTEMSHKLIHTVASLPRICPHFELPVQAGDDQVLQRMGRHYSVAHYRELVGTIRAQVPGSSVATDIIVGYPGESVAQFENTYDLVSSLRFDAVHIAKYSPRPGTPAARLADDVLPEEKERRRVRLEQLQAQIAAEINASLLGNTLEILVEENQRGRWKGRTVNNHLVFFEDIADWRGRLARVRIEHASAWSVRGVLVG